MIRTVHRAKYILADADLVLQNAAVHVSSPGRISRIEPWQGAPASPDIEVVDWGSAVIMPGLVNAHAHLELTCLHGRLVRFSSFCDWLSQLILQRRQWKREDYVESARRGSEMAVRSGTTLIGDISASGVSWEALRSVRLRKVVFEEALSFLPERAGEILASIEDRLNKREPESLLCPGISPHAPYSVSGELFCSLSALARRMSLPLAIHAAETLEEIEFLNSGTGAFRQFLTTLAVLPDAYQPPRMRPIPYLEKLGVLEGPVLLIHCNYLDPESMAIILRSRSSVVYCPRSHGFFGHAEHPVRELLDRGINVALGTDSLASNDSLSLLEEMRYLYRMRKDLKSCEIFRMATLNGAAALGFGTSAGRLRCGYWADMAVIELPADTGPKNLIAQILEGNGKWYATIVQGETAARRT
jgi:aminodeoxyfutalosine deaminase